MYYIYIITNLITEKKYVGFSSDYIERWKTHIQEANGKLPTRKILHLSIRKYGLHNFKFDVIYCSRDKMHTKNVMEHFFISEYNTLAPNGYNMTKGGEGGPGVTSAQASHLNQKRIENGTHNFLDKDFQDHVQIIMTETHRQKVVAGTHYLQSEGGKQMRIKAAQTQKLQIAAGTHFLQSEESRQEKIQRMAIMKIRPLINIVRELFIDAGEKIPRSLHTTSDTKLMIHKERLEQKIASSQISGIDLFSVC